MKWSLTTLGTSAAFGIALSMMGATTAAANDYDRNHDHLARSVLSERYDDYGKKHDLKRNVLSDLFEEGYRNKPYKKMHKNVLSDFYDDCRPKVVLSDRFDDCCRRPKNVLSDIFDEDFFDRGEIQQHADVDSNANTNVDVNIDANSNSDVDIDQDGDGGSFGDIDQDADVDSNADTDVDVDIDADSNSDVNIEQDAN